MPILSVARTKLSHIYIMYLAYSNYYGNDSFCISGWSYPAMVGEDMIVSGDKGNKEI